MKPVDEMTDAEIVEGVRSGGYAIVPLSEPASAVVGMLSADDFRGVATKPALLVYLTFEQARFVAQQVV